MIWLHASGFIRRFDLLVVWSLRHGSHFGSINVVAWRQISIGNRMGECKTKLLSFWLEWCSNMAIKVSVVNIGVCLRSAFQDWVHKTNSNACMEAQNDQLLSRCYELELNHSPGWMSGISWRIRIRCRLEPKLPHPPPSSHQLFSSQLSFGYCPPVKRNQLLGLSLTLKLCSPKSNLFSPPFFPGLASYQILFF